jgi:hypothetical protein
MAFCGYQLSRPKHLLEFVTLLVVMLGTSLAPVPVLAGPLDGDGSGTADVPLAANPEREAENAPAVSLADTGFCRLQKLSSPWGYMPPAYWPSRW